jgi:sensor histidine kinase regulating citrate/malate metabolism
MQQQSTPTSEINWVCKNPEKLSVYTDEDYVKSILGNHHQNTLKALQQTPNPHIIWTVKDSNDHIELSVVDNEPGISQEQLDALYNKQAVVGTKSGMGLHIIRDLAEVVQCKITMDTSSNQGTIFTLHFPKPPLENI